MNKINIFIGCNKITYKLNSNEKYKANTIIL